jgi:TRAP-type C4-dicarboxylate transport system substrate-binding protein
VGASEAQNAQRELIEKLVNQLRKKLEEGKVAFHYPLSREDPYVSLAQAVRQILQNLRQTIEVSSRDLAEGTGLVIGVFDEISLGQTVAFLDRLLQKG